MRAIPTGLSLGTNEDPEITQTIIKLQWKATIRRCHVIGYIKINTYVGEEAVWLKRKDRKNLPSVNVVDNILLCYLEVENDCY